MQCSFLYAHSLYLQQWPLIHHKYNNFKLDVLKHQQKRSALQMCTFMQLHFIKKIIKIIFFLNIQTSSSVFLTTASLKFFIRSMRLLGGLEGPMSCNNRKKKFSHETKWITVKQPLQIVIIHCLLFVKITNRIKFQELISKPIRIGVYNIFTYQIFKIILIQLYANRYFDCNVFVYK